MTRQDQTIYNNCLYSSIEQHIDYLAIMDIDEVKQMLFLVQNISVTYNMSQCQGILLLGNHASATYKSLGINKGTGKSHAKCISLLIQKYLFHGQHDGKEHI